MCEWQGCGRAFRVPKEVEAHAMAAHCPVGADDVPCLWSRCDGMRRKRFSLMTHIQDRHCHPQVREKLSVRPYCKAGLPLTLRDTLLVGNKVGLTDI